MKARKEIDNDEYNEQRKKYNNELFILDEKKRIYLNKNIKMNNKVLMDEFIKKIQNVILSDDESMFRIFCSIIDTILVENLELDINCKRKMMLHFKLKVVSKNSDLNLKEFLLLFSNN